MKTLNEWVNNSRISTTSFYQDEACWEWLRSKNNGYGQYWIDGKSQYIHRVAYELFVGPIINGCIDHLCRNRSCFNPNHLEVVSLGENVRRGTCPAAHNISKKVCINGHPFVGDNLRYVKTKSGYGRMCNKCLYERNKKWRINNPEKKKISQRKYKLN